MSAENGYSPRVIGIAAGVGLAAGLMGGSGSHVRAVDVQHSPDSGHELVLDALPPWMVQSAFYFADAPITGEAELANNQVTEQGAEEDPLATEDENTIYLPFAARPRGAVGTAMATATSTEAKPTATATAKSTETATTTATATATATASPTATAVPASPTPGPIPFDPEGLPSIDIFDGRVVLTTGGSDAVDWRKDFLDYQVSTIPGTAVELGSNDTGVSLDVNAQPEMPAAPEGSMNKEPESDPSLEFGGNIGRYPSGQIFDARTRAFYDAETGQWLVNSTNPCDEEPEDTATKLTDTSANIVFLGRNNQNGEQHFVQITTPEGVCSVVVPVNSEQPLTGDNFRWRSLQGNFPGNTKALELSDVHLLGERQPLALRYPGHETVTSFVNQYGPIWLSIDNNSFWQSPDGLKLLLEGYANGLTFEPGDAYVDPVQRLAFADLTIAMAAKYGWGALLPSYVNSNGGAPREVTSQSNNYANDAVAKFIRGVALDAQRNLRTRWSNFPSLELTGVANPASDDDPSRRRRFYINYHPYEGSFNGFAESHVEKIGERIFDDEGNFSLQQRGIIFGKDKKIVSHFNQILSDIRDNVPPTNTQLVFPVDLEVDGTGKTSADFVGALGVYPQTYKSIFIRLDPRSVDPDLAASAIVAGRSFANVNVAVPGNPHLLFGEPVTAAMQRIMSTAR